MITRIAADSSCELKDSPDGSFVTVPLTISTDERSYSDTPELDTDSMLNYLAAHPGRSYTACPSVDSWLKCFEGADIIYIVAMTSALSGTVNSALSARDIYLQEHPDVKIHIFDTLSTGPENAMLIRKLQSLISEGRSFDEICSEGSAYLKTTRLFFSLKSLHNLACNGRVNKALASAAGILGISVLATANSEGRIHPIGKCRSPKKTVSAFIEHIEKAGYRGGRIFISHVHNPSLAEALKSAVLTLFPDADVNILSARGLCSYYAERGGMLVGCECS